MDKDFKKWHGKKQDIDKSANRVYFHEREVWWCSIGINVGFEQDGKGDRFARPVIIFKKFNNEVCWAIPLTTKLKSGKFYLSVNLEDSIKRSAILSQLRLVDSKRLYQKIGVIDNKTYKVLIDKVVGLCVNPK